MTIADNAALVVVVVAVAVAVAVLLLLLLADFGTAQKSADDKLRRGIMV